jgi:integrase/recombinase XerD
MTDQSALGPWVKRFLLEYLPGERNFTRNTQQSYRDGLRLLIVFAAASLHKKPDQLLVEEICADLLRKFMRHIEEARKCRVSTRNQRLAAIHELVLSDLSQRNIVWDGPNAPSPFSTQRARHGDCSFQ